MDAGKSKIMGLHAKPLVGNPGAPESAIKGNTLSKSDVDSPKSMGLKKPSMKVKK